MSPCGVYDWWQLLVPLSLSVFLRRLMSQPCPRLFPKLSPPANHLITLSRLNSGRGSLKYSKKNEPTVTDAVYCCVFSHTWSKWLTQLRVEWQCAWRFSSQSLQWNRIIKTEITSFKVLPESEFFNLSCLEDRVVLICCPLAAHCNARWWHTVWHLKCNTVAAVFPKYSLYRSKKIS